ncbi:hypothetical protein BBI10_25460 [Pseudomonas graminis]|uniref:Uncharacterized protein n=1 Tax=Pseudomonas graminis TaxID=158627 RepID=A0A1C2D9T6_9PSED|nr:hypothetical protein BBI10_25460 [Pseudomonas graminis]
MIQAFRGGFGVTTEWQRRGGRFIAGLRRRAILSGLGASGHPWADGQDNGEEKITRFIPPHPFVDRGIRCNVGA